MVGVHIGLCVAEHKGHPDQPSLDQPSAQGTWTSPGLFFVPPSPPMYVPAQTNNAGWRAICHCRFVTSYGHDFGRMISMKHTSLREINQDMALRHARRNLH